MSITYVLAFQTGTCSTPANCTCRTPEHPKTTPSTSARDFDLTFNTDNDRIAGKNVCGTPVQVKGLINGNRPIQNSGNGSNDIDNDVHDETDDNGRPSASTNLQLSALLYTSLAHSQVSFSTAMAMLFVAATIMDFSYPVKHSCWFVVICGLLLFIRALVYTQTHYTKADMADYLRSCPCYQCYFGPLSFYTIPGVIFISVGLLFLETAIMFICGCILVGLGLLFSCQNLVFGQLENQFKYELETVFSYKLALFFICACLSSIMIVDPSFPACAVFTVFLLMHSCDFFIFYISFSLTS